MIEIWGPLTIFFVKKVGWGQHGSANVFLWGDFKPYSSHFGPVVWILEALIYSAATFGITIFGR